MASRLSAEEETSGLASVLDTGHQGMMIEATPALPALMPESVDLDALLVADDPMAAVQAVPPQQLFQALITKGPEDCIEVLPLLSDEQVVRLMDYDAWRDDRIELRRAARWLSLFKEVGDEEFYKRFRDLDEEYQLALLGPYIDLFDEDQYEKLGHTEQDALHRLPCGTLHYRIKSDDPVVVDFVTSLIEATLSSDVPYAYALLTHAAFNPPNEAESQIAQFRAARLTEDGFVTYEESLTAFRPIDLRPLEQKYLLASVGPADRSSLPVHGEDKRPFLDAVIARLAAQSDTDVDALRQKLVHLANSLCAALRVEPDDVASLKHVLAHAQALLSLGLEYLAAGSADLGVTILHGEHPQTLFRVGLTLAGKLPEATLRRFKKHGLPRADIMLEQLALGRHGALLLNIDQNLASLLGFERTETLKGACNRLPVIPIKIQQRAARSDDVVFAPVGSLADLSRLASKLDTVTGLLAVAALADDDAKAATDSLDRRLLTALARVLAGGQFTSRPLTANELDKLLAVSLDAVQTVAADVMRSIEGSLRLDIVPGGKDGWSVSHTCQVAVSDPVQGVMAELADLLLQLSTALRHARETGHGLAQASLLAGLIDIEQITGGQL